VSRFKLSVDLFNLAIEERMTCAIEVDELASATDKHTPVWADCVTPNTPGASSPKTITSTKLMYDPEYGVLGVKQSWMCAGPGQLFGGAS
jgi:hypothetical protein